MAEKLDRAVNLRLSASIYEELANEATRNGRKFSDHIRYVLVQGLEALRRQDPTEDKVAVLQERIEQLERLVRRAGPRLRPKKKRRPSVR